MGHAEKFRARNFDLSRLIRCFVVARRFLGASIQPEQTLLAMEVMPGGDLFSQIKEDRVGFFRWHQRCCPRSQL